MRNIPISLSLSWIQTVRGVVLLGKTQIRQLKHCSSSSIINHLESVREHESSFIYLDIYLGENFSIYLKIRSHSLVPFTAPTYRWSMVQCCGRTRFPIKLPSTRFTALRLNQWWHITDLELSLHSLLLRFWMPYFIYVILLLWVWTG